MKAPYPQITQTNKRLTTKRTKGISPRRRGERGVGTKEETMGTPDFTDYTDSDKEGKEEKRKRDMIHEDTRSNTKERKKKRKKEKEMDHE